MAMVSEFTKKWLSFDGAVLTNYYAGGAHRLGLMK